MAKRRYFTAQQKEVIVYRAWGEDRYASGTVQTAYLYTGQRNDPGLGGLMFYNARWYDPALGRFAQADSIIPGPGNPLAWDRYSYVMNSPLMYTDPSGHTSACAGGSYGYAGAEDCADYNSIPPGSPSIDPPSSSCLQAWEECYNVYQTYVELVNILGYVPSLEDIILYTMGSEYWIGGDKEDFGPKSNGYVRTIGGEALARNLYERCKTGNCKGDALYAFLAGYEPWFKHSDSPGERAQNLLNGKPTHENARKDAKKILDNGPKGYATRNGWTKGQQPNSPWQWITFTPYENRLQEASYGYLDNDEAILYVNMENGQYMWFFTYTQSQKWANPNDDYFAKSIP